MNSLAAVLAVATMGVDFGWREVDNGRFEYLVQIEPEQVRSIMEGQAIVSDLPPEVRSLRRIRITVGREILPRETIKQASAEIAAPGARGPRQPIAEPSLIAPGDDASQEPAREKKGGEINDDNGAGDSILGKDRDSQAAALGFGTPQLPKAGQLPHLAARESAGQQRSESPPLDKEQPSASASPSDTAANTDGAKSKAEAREGESSSLATWLTASLVALFASLGANFYQGWNLVSARRRYYQLVDRLGLRMSPDSDGITIESYAK
jgi:hypothetical protein